jgi:hypothetical protein
MADPHAILLVPTEAGAALLADGACRSRPPGVTHDTRNGEWVDYLSRPDALPLWWGGALVPEGWDRARRVLLPLAEAWSVLALPAPPLDMLLYAALWGAKHDICRVVLLDLVDGRLVERAG